MKQPSNQPLGSYDLGDLSVLLAEPRFFMRRILRTVLSELRIKEINEGHSVEHAFEQFCESPVDIVLTDWSPGFDGIKLLRQLRGDMSPNPFVPVVVVTANTESRHVYTARDAGMTEFLAKPVSVKSVYTRLCMVIEKQRAFVKCPDFFGPDRRRKRAEYNGPERRGEREEDRPRRLNDT